jgi:hypothetical protein
MADMSGSTSGMEARIAELEARVRQMEKRERDENPLRKVMRELMPAEAREHIRAARKEQLLAMRSFLDHWIEKTEHSETADRRERITLD